MAAFTSQLRVSVALPSSSCSQGTCVGKKSRALPASAALYSNYKLGKPQFLAGKPLVCRQSRNKRVIRKPVQCAAADSVQVPPETPIFGQELQLSPPQQILRSVPPPIRLLACAVLVFGAGGAGFAIGGRAGLAGQIVGALALGAVGAGAAYGVNQVNKGLAAVELHNELVKHPDVSRLRADDVRKIAQRFGVDPSEERFALELKAAYDKYLSSIIPPGSENLKGDEVDRLIEFKNALGLQDPDAANVHMELGRRISRSRLETGDRDSAVSERRSFQKLIFISTLVFGEAAKFLLPWKRVFNVTDAQVAVAIRDNGMRLFTARLEQQGAEPDTSSLQDLRQYQLKLKLEDDVVSEAVRVAIRQRAEGHIKNAVGFLNARTRIKDTAAVLRELRDLLSYNKALTAISNSSDKDDLVPGVGSVQLFGGSFDSDRQMNDLKQLYRTYLLDALQSPTLEDERVDELAQLKLIFGMGNKEAEDVTNDVTSRVYRKRLRDSVTDGSLDAAPSKAAFLQEVCDALRFDAENAFKVHEEVYRQKLEACLEDKKLDDEDSKALLRLRVLLCIPEDTVKKAHSEICGRIFTKVIDEALAESVDSVTPHALDMVHNAKEDLRLDQSMTLEILGRAVRAIFCSYIKRSRSMSRLESAKELKKMVFFSNMVVRPLVEDLKGLKPDIEAEMKALEGSTADEESEEEDDVAEEEELALPESLQKTVRAARKEARGAAKGSAGMMKAQKDINVKDDFDLQYRQDLYRGFLLYCLSGDVVTLPLGATITIDRDESEFVRLAQLGDILGLAAADVANVHKGLAEQAFRTNAQSMLSEGQLTKEKMEALKKLQGQLGLSDEAANRVIRAITAQKMVSGVESAVAGGRLSAQDVKEMRESGVDIDAMVSKTVRQTMFTKEVEKLLGAGTGEFDRKRIFEELPADLGLEADKLQKLVVDMAKERKRASLVQAVASLRQKKQGDLVANLRNLVACDKAAPDLKLDWSVREELLDLYGVFIDEAKPTGEEKERLQRALSIDKETAQKLEAVVASGAFDLGVEDENALF